MVTLAGACTMPTEMRFTNYGYHDDAYAASPITLDESDAVDRLSIQLYDHVAALADIEGKVVLDVGSGHGGGSHYVAKYLNPRRVVGMDLAADAIAFSENNYDLPNLCFVRGHAEDFPFPDDAFDSVINVESSHSFGSMSNFLKEVKRVLRPGGYLHMADLRAGVEVPVLEAELSGSGLAPIQKQDISANVMRALALDHERRVEWIQKSAPEPLWSILLDYAGTKGSKVYNLFESGSILYQSYLLQKTRASSLPR